YGLMMYEKRPPDPAKRPHSTRGYSYAPCKGQAKAPLLLRLLSRLGVEARQRAGLGLGSCVVTGDLVIEAGNALEDFGLMVGAGEAGDLLEFGDPPIGLWKHVGHGAAELVEQRDLALLEFSPERGTDTGALGRERQRRAQRHDP